MTNIADGGDFSIISFKNSLNTTIFSINNNGDATLSGNLTVNSDRRLKKSITNINDSLALIQQIKAVTYFWKPELARSKSLQYGVIAQNVEKALPELIYENKKGIKSVNYLGLIPVLVNAAQSQQQQLNKQKKRIEKQNQQIDLLIQSLSAE